MSKAPQGRYSIGDVAGHIAGQLGAIASAPLGVYHLLSGTERPIHRATRGALSIVNERDALVREVGHLHRRLAAAESRARRLAADKLRLMNQLHDCEELIERMRANREQYRNLPLEERLRRCREMLRAHGETFTRFNYQFPQPQGTRPSFLGERSVGVRLRSPQNNLGVRGSGYLENPYQYPH